MSPIAAALIVWRSPYTFRTKHEWRGVRIDRLGLWPLVTIGRWSWHALGPAVGAQQERVMDALRCGATPEPEPTPALPIDLPDEHRDGAA